MSYRTRLAAIRCKRLRQIAAYARDVTADDKRRAAVRGYLSDTRIVECLIAFKLPRASDYDIKALAAGVDLFHPVMEPITVSAVPKSTGGTRLVCNLGPQQKLRHAIIKDVVEAQFVSHGNFFDMRRTGTSKAVQLLASAIENVGPYVLAADISRCSASVNVDALYGADLLPPEVIRCALDHRHLAFVREETQTQQKRHYDISDLSLYTMEGADPTGLLQGSPASNALLRHLLAAPIKGACAEGGVVVYVDNFYIATRTEADCGRVGESLARHLARCSAGPLRFGMLNVEHAQIGFDALGYHLRQHARGEHCRIELPARTLLRLERELDAEVDRFGRLAERAVERLAAGFLTAYPALSAATRQLVLDEYLMHSTWLALDMDDRRQNNAYA